MSRSLCLSVGFTIQDEAMDVARSAPQGAHYHEDAFLLASLTGNKDGSKCLMVIRVKPTPTRFPTNSLYTPMDNTPLHSISSVCRTWGWPTVIAVVYD